MLTAIHRSLVDSVAAHVVKKARLGGGIFTIALSAAIGAQGAQLSATPDSLLKTLSRARPGDQIVLAPGSYPSMMIKGVSFTRPVTIASADPKNPAVISDLQIIGAQGLAFRDIEFVTTKGWAVLSTKSSDISFDHVFVHGSLDNDSSNDGGGLSFLNTSGVNVTNSEFTQLRQGISDGADRLVVNGQMTMGTPAKAVIRGNVIHDIMKSGMVFAGVSDVLVTHNTIRDIRVVPPAHPDAIQFFTTGMLVPAHDITVSDNLILRGDGAATQGIFFRDQVGSLHYERVTITDNLIIGTGYGGIYVDGVNGLDVTGNELTSMPGNTNRTFFLIQNSADVHAVNNKAVTISYDKVANLTETGNKVTKAENDGGTPAIASWLVRHPREKDVRPGISGRRGGG